MKRIKLVVFLAAVAIGCGGATPDQSTGPKVGESTGDDLDVDKQDPCAADGTGDGSTGPKEGAADGGEKPGPDTPAAPVTFVMKNTGSEDLVFNMDKGLQPVIFAFSGKPPKAKPIIMFPKFCTASCDAPEEGRCPYCPQPTKVRDIRAAEKREVVAPGKSFEAPWDAEVFVYKRTRGKRDGRTKRCECYTKEPVKPETYTVRACGLRVTKEAQKRSKYQCVDGTMTLPSEEPIRVELSFPDPK